MGRMCLHSKEYQIMPTNRGSQEENPQNKLDVSPWPLEPVSPDNRIRISDFDCGIRHLLT